MIIIQNVSPKDSTNTGENDYELRINRKLICKFKHNRQLDGLAECLRDAADSFEKAKRDQIENLL